MTSLLIGSIIILCGTSVFLAITNMKVKANNARLQKVNDNLEYNLATSLIRNNNLAKSKGDVVIKVVEKTSNRSNYKEKSKSR